jgi:Flp pilus assembly protein TadB
VSQRSSHLTTGSTQKKKKQKKKKKNQRDQSIKQTAHFHLGPRLWMLELYLQSLTYHAVIFIYGTTVPTLSLHLCTAAKRTYYILLKLRTKLPGFLHEDQFCDFKQIQNMFTSNFMIFLPCQNKYRKY